MPRWLRSLQVQLLLWAVLPVIFALLALAFTGVYTHQRAMRDFVAGRDLALARLTARILEDGLAHGTIAPDGSGLAAWLLPLVGPSVDPATLVIVDGEGRVLFHPDPQRVGADFSGAPGVAEVRAGQEGVVLAEGRRVRYWLPSLLCAGPTGLYWWRNRWRASSAPSSASPDWRRWSPSPPG
jgi:sensor histidine kinase regulating citrate/malate metabolism